MQDIIELERRISTALDRIGRGLESALPAVPPPAVAPPPAVPMAALSLELDQLRAELEAERATAAQLRDRLRAIRDREAAGRTPQDDRIEKMTRQLDVQGLELQRMRKTAVLLREELRRLREAQESGTIDAAQINRAMLAELDALRTTRLSELAELDELSAALDEHLTEAENA